MKRGGCANSIRTKLLSQALVQAVDVDVVRGQVRVEGDVESRAQLAMALARLGCPETGAVEGVRAASAKAKSFVSCAIVRIDSATQHR